MLAENNPIFEACLICLIMKFFSISYERRPFTAWRNSLIFFLCDCALISLFLNLRRHLLKTVRCVICNLKICKKTLKFMNPPYGWGSNVFMLQCHFERDSLFFTTLFPGLSGTHLIDLGRMKDYVEHGATQWFWNCTPGMGIQHLDH